VGLRPAQNTKTRNCEKHNTKTRRHRGTKGCVAAQRAAPVARKLINLQTLYPFLNELHSFLSRTGLVIGVVMFAVAFYIGIIRHGDVTRWFRLATYVVVGLMGVSALTGLGMYVGGGRPYQDVHVIYGAGAVLALPFFIFVEVTAKKRPAMGSYLWGFALMAAIILRAIVTGAA